MRVFLSLLILGAVSRVSPAVAFEFASPEEVTVETRCLADSVTVGQRFVVTHTFLYSDTISMLPVVAVNAGKSRLISLQWRDEVSNAVVTRRARLELMSLDLVEARLPQQTFDFVTLHGDTLRVITDEIVLPVRSLTASSQAPAPLKGQWEAPRNWWPWIIGAIAAALIAAIALLLWKRYSQKKSAPVFVPALPPDYVALTELIRIEGLGLVDKGEFKRYYTLVVDTVRHYVEARFKVEAMDRTTLELLADLDRNSVRVDGLEPLLCEADLVKFAKYEPQASDAERTMHASREIVVKTTPRAVVVEGTGETDVPETEEAS